jgi:transposase
MSPRKEHQTPKIARFKALVEAGHSQREAAKSTGVPRSTAQRWLGWEGDRRQKRSGRPPLLSSEKVDALIAKITESAKTRSQSYVDSAAAIGISISRDTVRRIVNKRGYGSHIPYCSSLM